MKKIVFLLAMLIGAQWVWSQDLDDIRKYNTVRQFVKAKEAMDKFMSNPANAAKPDAWYLKAYTYNAVSLEPNTPAANATQYNREAFDAIKKYMELDPKHKLTLEEENNTVFNIYSTFYDLAAKAYNSKDYEQSYNQFASVLEVHDYIFSNNLVGAKGLKFSSLDTDVVFNMILLGNELKKPDGNITYYKKIVDAGLTDEKYLEAYEGMVMEYKRTKNASAFDEYLAKGKAKFPKDEFWEAIDIEFNTEGLEKAALHKKYDEMLLKYPNSYVLLFNYGYELYKYTSSDETKTEDVTALKAKIPELFKRAIAIRSTVEANMLTANFYYNSSFEKTEASKAIKGNKPEDVKKRVEMVSVSKTLMNQAIPFAEEACKLYAAMPKLKGSDKINYKQAYEILSTAYSMAGNAAKSAECDKKKEEVDKLGH